MYGFFISITQIQFSGKSIQMRQFYRVILGLYLDVILPDTNESY